MENVQMFYMDKGSAIIKDLSRLYKERCIDAAFWFMLGCACQGRGKEMQRYYHDILEHQPTRQNVLLLLKPLIIPLSARATMINTKPIRGLNITESVGEYYDRKSREDKDFMFYYTEIKKVLLEQNYL